MEDTSLRASRERTANTSSGTHLQFAASSAAASRFTYLLAFAMNQHTRPSGAVQGRAHLRLLQPPPASSLLLHLLLSSSILLPLLPPASAQYIAGSFLYNQSLGAGNDVLSAQLRDHPDLWTLNYPNKYRLPIDFYVYSPPLRDSEYTQNVVFDPCRGYEYDCCFDTYGTPEFLSVSSDPTATSTYGQRKVLYDDGAEMDVEISRRPEDELFIDESCEGENLPLGRTDCVMSRVARRPFSLTPRCWNWNTSISADVSCRSPLDGSPLPLCLELGITQTAFILECGGDFATNPHCGTYLEIHRPARTDKLSETRLRGLYPSGYRMTVMSTTYKGDEGKTLCYDPIKKGAYEVWWVMRTLYNFIVERRLPFTIISPECDWDGENNRYLPYATLFEADGVTRNARVLAGLDPFDPTGLLFTRPRVEGKAGFPGKGMGSTLVPTTDTTYHSTMRRDEPTWHNTYTYTYTPDKPEYTIKRGVMEPSIEEQAALFELVKRRGYRRLEDVGADTLDAMKAQVRNEIWRKGAKKEEDQEGEENAGARKGYIPLEPGFAAVDAATTIADSPSADSGGVGRGVRGGAGTAPSSQPFSVPSAPRAASAATGDAADLIVPMRRDSSAPGADAGTQREIAEMGRVRVRKVEKEMEEEGKGIGT